MSVLFTDTMTVFNHFCEEGKDSWKRTVINGVQWRHSKKELIVAKGVQAEERVESVTVDFSRGYGRPSYVCPLYTSLRCICVLLVMAWDHVLSFMTYQQL